MIKGLNSMDGGRLSVELTFIIKNVHRDDYLLSIKIIIGV